MALRVGILGAADIAPKALLDPIRRRDGDVVVTAVASRRAEAAAAYAERHAIPRAHTGYAALLADDDVDLALVYDYGLAPRPFGRAVEVTPLWTARWDLAVPAEDDAPDAGASPDVLRRYADAHWIANSRDTADETVLRTIAALAGFVPRLTHRADSLELVQDLIAARMGVGLLPADEPLREGVRTLELRDPEAVLRAYAVTRRGRGSWAPLALVVRLLS